MQMWIVGGGTGGHVYPALAVAQAVRLTAPDAELTWVGSNDGMEAGIVARRDTDLLVFLPVVYTVWPC